MEWSRTAALLGSGACLLVVLDVLVPYWLAPATGIGVYYGVTPVGPVAVGILALFALGVFVAGLAGRLAPSTVAGGTLVLGAAMVGVSVWWAGNVPPGVLERLSRAEVLAYHPAATVLVAVAALAAAGWYAVAAFRGSAPPEGAAY